MANRILGVFFLLWALDLLDGSLMLKGFYLDYPDWALLTESFPFLYGPLIYFYTLFSINGKKEIKFSDFLHLLPFLLGFCTLLAVYHLRSFDFKIEILKGIMALNQPIESYLSFLTVYVHFFFYIFISNKKLTRAVQNLEQYYSHPRLLWLQRLLFVLTVILAISIVSSVLQYFGATTYFNLSLIIILLSMGILVGRLIFNALDQQLPIVLQNADKKYSGSDLTDKEATEVQSKILQTLKDDELYLDPELSLDHLSEKIGAGKRKVSQVINERMGKSFFDLINTYRIDKAKQIFKESKDPKLTVLEVLYEVGFNSKSSFNTQFKNKTSLTPSEFKKLNL